MLTVKDCIEAMSKETVIHATKAKDDKWKRFTFNACDNDYSVWHDDGVIDSGNAIEELLAAYNDL
jgi:hypothetical protein